MKITKRHLSILKFLALNKKLSAVGALFLVMLLMMSKTFIILLLIAIVFFNFKSISKRASSFFNQST